MMNRITNTMPSHQDVATYLPRKPIQEFARKHTIYDPGQPCNNLYLVRSGRVIINNSFDGGTPVVTRIVGPNGIFGEALLIGGSEQSESAVVLDQARLMSWGRAELEQLITRDP